MKDTYSKINNICLVTLTGIALMAALTYTQAVLVPFVFSVFIYAVAAPLIRWFEVKWRLPHWAAVGVTLLCYLTVSFFLWFYIFISIQDFIRSAEMYQSRIEDFVRWTGVVANQLGYSIDEASIQAYVRQLPFFSVAKNITGGVLSFIGNVVLILIFTVFLIAGGKGDRVENPLIEEIQKKISLYITTKFFASLLNGVLAWIVFAIFDLELAFMFGVVTVFLNFIPNLGSLIATLLPVPVILLQFGFSWHLPVILALITGIQLVMGNVVETKLLGESMDLHPVVILLFLIFWGLVWGLPGMFMAVPITAIAKIILSRIETTRPLAEILAGRIPSFE